MSEEVVVPPLFVVAPTVPRWDSGQAARLIDDPSLSVAAAQRQIQRFAAAKWVNTVGQRGTGAKAANLFGPTAVASAKVLSVLTDLGVEDHATMGLASVPLGSWNNDQPRTPDLTPILAAMVGATQGQWWVFQLRLLRGDQTGKRHIRAWVYNPEEWSPSAEAGDPEMLPRAAVTLHLTPLLLPLHRRMQESVNAMNTPVSVH